MKELKKKYRRESTAVRDNHIHDLYNEISSELKELGDIGNYVAKEYIYLKIQEKTRLSIRTISYVLNHTKKVDLE